MSEPPDAKSEATALEKSTSVGVTERPKQEKAIIERGGAAMSLAGALTGALVAGPPGAVVGGLLGGLGVIAQILGSEAAKGQAQRMESDLNYFGRLLEEVRHDVGSKLDRDDVVEVICETAKDMVATSYAERRKRLARVAANGLRLLGDDLGRLRFMEKAAAALDDDHVEGLKWLASEAPLSDADVARVGMNLAEWHEARRKVLEGDLPEARIAELARFGFATPATEREKDLRVSSRSSGNIVGENSKLTRTTEHVRASITTLGREFLAWLAWPPPPSPPP